MSLKKIISVKGIMVAAAALLLFACKPEPVKVNGVTLNYKTLTLEVGRTETLKADVTPADAENKAVKWSVDKSSIVSISEKDGICTVSAEAIGEATVTATTVDGGCTASCKVQVVMPVPVDGVFVKPKPAPGEPPIFIQIGNTREFTAAVTPENATNKKVTWTAEPAEAVELTDNENGSCTVKGMEAGPVTLKATSVADSSISDSVMLQVRPVPVTGIKWTDDASDPLKLKMGSFVFVGVMVLPENATNKKLTYSVGTEGIIEVTPGESSFELKGNKLGTTTFTVTTEEGNFPITRDVEVVLKF